LYGRQPGSTECRNQIERSRAQARCTTADMMELRAHAANRARRRLPRSNASRRHGRTGRRSRARQCSTITGGAAPERRTRIALLEIGRAVAGSRIPIGRTVADRLFWIGGRVLGHLGLSWIGEWVRGRLSWVWIGGRVLGHLSWVWLGGRVLGGRGGCACGSAACVAPSSRRWARALRGEELCDGLGLDRRERLGQRTVALRSGVRAFSTRYGGSRRAVAAWHRALQCKPGTRGAVRHALEVTGARRRGVRCVRPRETRASARDAAHRERDRSGLLDDALDVLARRRSLRDRRRSLSSGCVRDIARYWSQRAAAVVAGEIGGATTEIGTSRPPFLLRMRIVVAPGALPTTTTAAADCWLPW